MGFNSGFKGLTGNRGELDDPGRQSVKLWLEFRSLKHCAMVSKFLKKLTTMIMGLRSSNYPMNPIHSFQ